MDAKSFLGAIGIETDDTPAPAPASKPQAQATPSTISATPAYQASTSFGVSADLGEVDKMNAKILPGESNYTLFRDFHAQMGGGDVKKTLSLLMSANHSVTPDKIRLDIKTALAAAQHERASFNQFIEQSKKDKVQGREAEIARLNAEIVQHQAEITRLTAAISAAQTQITTNQTQKLQNEQAINDGAAHFNAVMQAVEKPLLGAQNIFSNI